MASRSRVSKYDEYRAKREKRVTDTLDGLLINDLAKIVNEYNGVKDVEYKCVFEDFLFNLRFKRMAYCESDRPRYFVYRKQYKSSHGNIHRLEISHKGSYSYKNDVGNPGACFHYLLRHLGIKKDKDDINDDSMICCLFGFSMEFYEEL